MQRGIGGTEPEMEGGHAVPAVSFGKHLGQQAGPFARGRAPAGEAAFTGKLAEGGRVVATHEIRFAHEDRPLGHQPPGHDAPGHQRLLMGMVGLVERIGLVGIVAPKTLLVVHAVDRQRLVQQAMPAVDHHRPRGIQGHDRASPPADFGLHAFGKAQVAGIDESDFVFQRPDEDRGMIAFLLDRGLQLFDPVVEKFRTVAQLVQVVGPFAVENAAAADDDSPGVHQIECLLLVQPAELGAPKSPHILAVLAPLSDGRLGVLATVELRDVGPQRPGHAVELELAGAPVPLAEAEFGAPHIHRVAIFLDRGHHLIEGRGVGPPQPRILPGLGQIKHLLGTGRHRGLDGREGFFGLSARKRLHLVEDLHLAVRRRGIFERYFQAQLLFLHRGFHKDVGPVDATGRHQARRGEQPRFAAIVRSADGKIEILADPVLRAHPVDRRVERQSATLAEFLFAQRVIGILDDHAHFVDLPGVQRAGHVALPLREGGLGPAAELAVHMHAGNQAQRGKSQEERAACQPGRHVHPRAVDHAMAETERGLHFELVAGHGNRHPAGRGRIGQSFGWPTTVNYLLLVVTANLPQAGQRRFDSLRGPVAHADLKYRAGRLAVFVGLPIGPRLERAVGTELAPVQAHAIRSVLDLLGRLDDHFLRLAVGARLLLLYFFHHRQRTNLQRMPAGREFRVSQLDPGHFAPETQLHQVAGKHVGGNGLPGSAIDPPLERRAGGFQPDAIPRLVRARLGDRKIVLQQSALLGPLLGDLLGVCRHVEPLLTGKQRTARPLVGLELDVGPRGLFAFQPNTRFLRRSGGDQDRQQGQ